MRRARLGAILIVASMGSRPAWSQAPTVTGADASGPASSDNPGSSPSTTSDEDDTDTGDDGGVALPPAPADPTARDAWLVTQLDAAVAAEPKLGAATVGAAVIDVASGRTLWQHQADAPVNLASVTKVLTTSAALHAVGGGFRWRTSVYAERLDHDTRVVQGDLIVRGRGDPTLTLNDLHALARDVHWQGIDEVDGSLRFDGSYFDDVEEPPHFADQPRERAGYRAPIGAASLERNAVTIVVVPDRVNLGMADVSIDPPAGDYVKVVTSEVATVDSGRTRIVINSQVKRTGIELTITGQIQADEGPYFARRRVDDPVRLFGEAFRRVLADEGVHVRGKRIERGPVPAHGATLVAEHESPPLAEVIRGMNKNSDNYVAETLLKTIGAESLPPPPPDTPQRPATWADGLAVVHQYLTGVVGLPAASFRVENGSGLYDSTAISAGAVAQVLAAAWRDFRVGPDLASALATAGIDGTLRKRLGGAATRGRVRGKTGTLAAVSALAGFAGVDSGHPLAFAVVVNRLPAGTRGDARHLQDAIAAIAVAYGDHR